MNNTNLIEITVRCLICENPFDTVFVVSDGKTYDFCCSMKCYHQWNSKENRRDRLLNVILNK
jgi:ribosomal protein L24E